ncbi:MAG: hemerythrin family protein [bacterium]|nr:hemerythrin family protein [bacterium]
MSLFIWKDEYSVNIEPIDKQHKMLIGILNELHEAMLERQSRELLAGIITSLVDYTGVHFAAEEKYMQKYNFPGYISHKKEHDNFVKKVTDFQTKHAAGSLMLSMEVMHFLRDWLREHILGTDKKYSAYFKRKGLN